MPHGRHGRVTTPSFTCSPSKSVCVARHLGAEAQQVPRSTSRPRSSLEEEASSAEGGDGGVSGSRCPL